MRRTALIALLLTGPLVAGAGPAPALDLTPVPMANPKSPGVVAPNVLSPELAEVVRSRGAMLLENGASPATHYGYDDDQPTMLPSPGSNVEAHKTLFQRHESGPGAFPNQQGSTTRINLDADVAHRVTLLATADANGAPLPTFDGSTWYPWAGRLPFTAEFGNAGGVWQATLDVPSAVEDISGALGRAGYDGIQADSDGNLWLVEDAGGRSGTVNTLVYRFVPCGRRDLKGGGARTRRLGDGRLWIARHARLRQRRRQRGDGHPRLGRRPDDPGAVRGPGALAAGREVAGLLHAAARRQHDVRDHPESEPAGQRRPPARISGRRLRPLRPGPPGPRPSPPLQEPARRPGGINDWRGRFV
jgi:hypothetical protein